MTKQTFQISIAIALIWAIKKRSCSPCCCCLESTRLVTGTNCPSPLRQTKVQGPQLGQSLLIGNMRGWGHHCFYTTWLGISAPHIFLGAGPQDANGILPYSQINKISLFVFCVLLSFKFWVNLRIRGLFFRESDLSSIILNFTQHQFRRSFLHLATCATKTVCTLITLFRPFEHVMDYFSGRNSKLHSS